MNIAIPKNFLAFALPISILLSIIAFVNTSFFAHLPHEICLYLTIDIVFSIPLVYFLLIRKKKDIPKYTVVSVFMLSLIAASYIIPIDQQGLLNQVKLYAIPIVELAVITFVIVSTRRITKHLKSEDNPDYYIAIIKACQAILPNRLGALMATELSVIYFGLFPLKKVDLTEETFTYFRKNGIRTTIGALLGLALVEMIVMHLILHSYYPKTAWILSILTLYTCIQIIALLRSMPARVTKIDKQKQELTLNYGFFSTTTIPLASIMNVELNTRALPEETDIVQFSPLGALDSHNIILHISEEQELRRLYGMKAKYRKLAIYIDEKDKFKEMLTG